MAAFVQDDVGAPADGGALAFTNNVVAGNLLVAMLSHSAAFTINSITDSQGNTWQEAVAGGSSMQTRIWYARAGSSGACTLTFDYAAAAAPQTCIIEASGFPNGVATDDIDFNNAATGSNVAHAPNNVTNTVSSTFAACAMRVASSFSLSSRGDGYTTSTNQSRSINGYKAHSTTETVNADVTFAASESIAGAIAIFKDQAPSASPTRGRISFSTAEAPFLATRGRLSFSTAEAPFVATRGRLSFTETEAPLVLARGRVSFTELQAPDLVAADPTRGRISFAEFEGPSLAATRGRLSFSVVEAPLMGTRGRLSFTVVESPLAAARGRVSFAAAEAPEPGAVQSTRRSVSVGFLLGWY